MLLTSFIWGFKGDFMKKNILKFVALYLSIIATMIYLSEVFVNKSVTGAFSNSIRIRGFYQLEEDSLDMLFVGSSHSYTSISPNYLKENYDISAYNFATAEQPIPVSYYYIKEALKTQKPKTVVLESYMINLYPEYREVNIRSAVDNMPFSINKIDLINNLVPKDELKYYYFPILKYHTRWNDLTLNDFIFDYKTVGHNLRGQVALDGKKIDYTDNSSYEIPKSSDVKEFTWNERDKVYLDKIIKLLNENEIELIIYTAPYTMSEDEKIKQQAITKYAESNNLKLIDINRRISQFDFDVDFYDNGHLSKSGATKATDMFITNYYLIADE